jgi:hypothetical protein
VLLRLPASRGPPGRRADDAGRPADPEVPLVPWERDPLDGDGRRAPDVDRLAPPSSRRGAPVLRPRGGAPVLRPRGGAPAVRPRGGAPDRRSPVDLDEVVPREVDEPLVPLSDPAVPERRGAPEREGAGRPERLGAADREPVPERVPELERGFELELEVDRRGAPERVPDPERVPEPEPPPEVDRRGAPDRDPVPGRGVRPPDDAWRDPPARDPPGARRGEREGSAGIERF